MIVKMQEVERVLYIHLSAENDLDRATLTQFDLKIASSARFRVAQTIGRPDGTVGALTLEECEDDPRE